MPDDARRRLGTAIRRVRERAELDQQELADAVGVSVRTVGRYESGRSWPGYGRIRRIDTSCRAGGVLLRLWQRLVDEVEAASEARPDQGREPDGGHDDDEGRAAVSGFDSSPLSERTPAGRRWRWRETAIAAIVIAGVAIAVVVATQSGISASGANPTGPPLAQVRFARLVTGPVWIEITRGRGRGGEVALVLRWGPKVCRMSVAVGSHPAYLTTHKTGHDSVPLSVWASPSGIVRFGAATPPVAGDAIAIDSCWTSQPS
jgi:transcriptional regulator with XRE-family HTH domain